MLGSSTAHSTANLQSSILSVHNVNLPLHWFIKKYGIKLRQGTKYLLYSTHFQALLPGLDNDYHYVIGIVNILHKSNLKLLVNLFLFSRSFNFIDE